MKSAARGTIEAELLFKPERVEPTERKLNHLVQRAEEEVDGIALFEFFTDLFKGRVNHALSDGLFALAHDGADQVGDQRAVEARVSRADAFFGFAAT